MPKLSNKLLLLHSSRIGQLLSKSYAMPFLQQINIILGRKLVIEYSSTNNLPDLRATINS